MQFKREINNEVRPSLHLLHRNFASNYLNFFFYHSLFKNVTRVLRNTIGSSITDFSLARINQHESAIELKNISHTNAQISARNLSLPIFPNISIKICPISILLAVDLEEVLVFSILENIEMNNQLINLISQSPENIYLSKFGQNSLPNSQHHELRLRKVQLQHGPKPSVLKAKLHLISNSTSHINSLPSDGQVAQKL